MKKYQKFQKNHQNFHEQVGKLNRFNIYKVLEIIDYNININFILKANLPKIFQKITNKQTKEVISVCHIDRYSRIIYNRDTKGNKK